MQGATIALKLRWSDFTTLTRQTTLSSATDQEVVIAASALHLFAETWQAGLPVRLIGVGVSSLGTPSAPVTLWESVPAEVQQRRQVEALLRAVRARFGERIIWWGREWQQAQMKGEER